MELPLYPYIILALLAFNVAAFLLFGYDKINAKRNHWRVPESTLLLSALLGPFGAYYGMRFFHHKTAKRKFLLVPIFMLMHMAALVCMVIFLI